MTEKFNYRDLDGKPRHAIFYAGFVWHLDVHSTQLSRKHSVHLLCGNLRYTRIKI